jgi:hypothetical protein
MLKKALRNALLAVAYICGVATIMFYFERFAGPDDSVILPIAMLCLFTLSAAVMGYLFFYQPAELYFANNKKGAFKLFIQTVAIFATVTALIFITLISGVFSR